MHVHLHSSDEGARVGGASSPPTVAISPSSSLLHPSAKHSFISEKVLESFGSLTMSAWRLHLKFTSTMR